MKIEKSEHYVVERDGVEFIRLGENNWLCLFGFSWEPIWDDEELENEFQKKKSEDNEAESLKYERFGRSIYEFIGTIPEDLDDKSIIEIMRMAGEYDLPIPALYYTWLANYALKE